MRAKQFQFIKTLQGCFNRFETEARQQKLACMAEAKKIVLPANALLLYHDLLLFVLAHPDDEKVISACQSELGRLSKLLKVARSDWKETLENSGLPYTLVNTRFSPDMLEWLLWQKDYKVEINFNHDESEQLGALLKVTLPSSERELTTYGFNTEELLDALKVNRKNVPSFISSQIRRLSAMPLVKDYFFELLELDIKVKSKRQDFSRSYNRFLTEPLFFHSEMLKRFNAVELINRPIARHINLNEKEKEHLIKTIKNSLVLTARETDPATYMDAESLRYYALDRGIAVAIYGMIASRQLPFESYVGYTLFKNGFPAAYGGAWVFGRRSLFGMNIFESFRGGESGYMMCQLLRVYRQVFGVSSFEVEPYQFGKDNPDGIKSGAFWFYYRHGFRPVDKVLNTVAEREAKKISLKKGYQSSYKILERFTDSFICLELEKTRQVKVSQWSAGITRLINKSFGGNRTEAENKMLGQLFANVKLEADFFENAHCEYSLLAGSLNIKENRQKVLIRELAEAKPKNLYLYQQLLLKFLEEIQ